ncbi:hypothetical protein B0H10DRAFT_2188539 [Mycena sp. CBHHK59/15]|nr:hypothetical protein B0H10DRAFT_2188539 [Mycena sp. CBHHK59/15]
MEMPGLKTRRKNKDIHPAIDAGVAPRSRRTTSEVATARSLTAKEKKKAELAQKEAVEKVAALEDKQREIDISRAEHGNHPVDQPIPLRTMSPQPQDNLDDDQNTRAESGDDSGQFVPLKESSDKEDPTSDEEEIQKPSKLSKPKRTDVTASRSTRDASGTPATSASSGHKRKASVENSKDKKKKKAGKKAGLVRSKAADPKQAASSGRSSVGGVTEEDESMVKFGGPAIDDDVDEQIERAQPAQGKKRGLPQNPIIKIAPTAPRPLTKKEQRNNAKKWSLPHLPRNTASQFTEEVIPLARELLGTLPPWAVLTVKQVQEIVDKVYGAGKHIVLFDGPWFGLVAYRASDWRSGFGIQALKGIQALINMYQGADNSESDEEAAGPLSDDPLDAAPKPAKFTFDTPEGIAAFVAWALQKHAETGTMAFHWQTWGNGVDKKGLLQSHLIMYTFAHHLSALKTIPDLHKHLEAEPSGALLLSVQAVERALQFWTTGQQVVPPKTAGHFSVDHWGDIKTVVNNKKVTQRRATQFLATVSNWDGVRWNDVREAASEWVEMKKRASSSRASSEAEGAMVSSEEEEVIILSD